MEQIHRIGFVADPIRPRINLTSGFNPLLRKQSVFGTSIPSKKKSRAVRMMYDFSTLLEHFTTSATHGNQLPDDLQLPPLREVHPAGMDASVNHKQTNRRSLSTRIAFYTT